MIRALLVASAAALAAGVAGVLALDAATRSPRTAVVVAIAAVWIPQVVLRARRHPRRPSKWARVYGGKPMPEHIYIRRHRTA